MSDTVTITQVSQTVTLTQGDVQTVVVTPAAAQTVTISTVGSAYTDTNARQAISVVGGTGLSYNSTTGVVSYAQQSLPLSKVSDSGGAASLDAGTSSGNLVQLVDVGGTVKLPAVDGSALTNLPSTPTFGIANTNAVKIDSTTVADDEYARFTANGLESRSTSEVLSDIGAAASSHNHAAGDITSGTLAVARIPDITLAKVTDSGGAAALDVGTGSGTVCAGDDGRLSDARTPTSHNHAASEITSGTLAVARIPDLTLSKITDAGTAAAAATGDFEASGSIATHNAITTAHGISSFGSTLVDDADAAAARSTLGAAASNHTHTLANITDSGTAAALDVGITSNDVLQVSTSGVTANEFLRLEAIGTKVTSRTAAEVLSDIGAFAASGVSSFGATLIDDADAAAARTTLGAQATLTSPVTSPAMTGVSAGSITGVIKCSQAQYDAITPVSTILYVIV